MINRILAIAISLLLAWTLGCASRASESAPSQKQASSKPTAIQGLTRKPLSDIQQIRQAVGSAIEQTQLTFQYDPSYVKLDYPGGDVPIERGVCADVIVRAFRTAGVDLQKEVHEDMTRHFEKYPRLWSARRPDSNIDHRRVPNLMTFLNRAGSSVQITSNASDYLPGDVVAWRLDNNLFHIGLVTDALGHLQNYLMVHNIGAGARLEDVLFSWKIIGHYRMWKQR